MAMVTASSKRRSRQSHSSSLTWIEVAVVASSTFLRRKLEIGLPVRCAMSSRTAADGRALPVSMRWIAWRLMSVPATWARVSRALRRASLTVPGSMSTPGARPTGLDWIRRV